MSYLKLIANAIWAGAYGSLVIALLLFLLNDNLAAAGVFSLSFLGAVAGLALIYLPVLSLFFPTLFICVRFFAARRLGIGWASLKAIVWLGAATLATLTIVFYVNLRRTSSLLSPDARSALRASCIVMAACCLLAVAAAGIGQIRPGGRARVYRLAAGGLLLLPVLVMAALMPQAAVGPSSGAILPAAPAGDRAPQGPSRSLLLIGLEAASMDFILPMASAGKLPTFDRLVREGASARLNSLTPCVSMVAWISLSTGMPPWSSGVRDTQVYSLAMPPGWTLEFCVMPRSLGLRRVEGTRLVRSARRAPSLGRRPTFWQILPSAGVEVDLIGWPGGDASPSSPAVIPQQDARVSAVVDRILGLPEPSDVADATALVRALRRAISADLSARAGAIAAHASQAPSGTRVLAMKLPGLGSISRRFLRYHLPEEFGNVTPREQAAFGVVLPRYYEFLDQILADLIAAAGPDASVMIVSAHGVEPVSGWEKLARQILIPSRAAGQEASFASGSWRRGPDGVLIAHGWGVAAGAKIDDADILDILPTILYMLGLPIGRDMPGNLLRRLFDRQHLESHAVLFIPGYGAAP